MSRQLLSALVAIPVLMCVAVGAKRIALPCSCGAAQRPPNCPGRSHGLTAANRVLVVGDAKGLSRCCRW